MIDRTELIIEVFAQRAQTREAAPGRACQSQIPASSLKKTVDPPFPAGWQRGAAAAAELIYRGEGEKQIELDRRVAKSTVAAQKEIEDVQAQRDTQRRNGLRTGIPTFAIVGYTNAGKSTLLNALTKADVLVEDKLFATLDTHHAKYLPSQSPRDLARRHRRLHPQNSPYARRRF